MSIAVHSQGSGPDIALIHGWGFPAAVWQPLATLLAARCRVHCVDLPGYGASAADPGATLQTTADRVMAALPERVTLCGWSLGAHVALAALARHSRRVDGLVMVGATPCFLQRPDWPEAVDPTLLGLFEHALGRGAGALLARFAVLSNQGDAAARDISRQLTALAAQPPTVEVLRAGLAWLAELDLRPVLPAIGRRSLLIHGAHDPLVPLAAARSVAALLPAARLECFEHSAHAPFLSDPRRFARCVADFVVGAPATC